VSDLDRRIASTSGRVLVRSAIEIAHALTGMVQRCELLTAAVSSGDQLFLSRLLRVDADAGLIVVACSDTKHANSALLGEKAITFRCNHGGTHYEFTAGEPRQVAHAGEPAIQLSFPLALLALQRRLQPRVAVPPRVPLRCEARLEGAAFEAQVVDISLKGLGAIIYAPAIHIKPGTVLEKTRIVHPKRAAIVLDLLVRHVTLVAQRDGSYVNRAGCSFLGEPKDIEDLIRLFVTELGP